MFFCYTCHSWSHDMWLQYLLWYMCLKNQGDDKGMYIHTYSIRMYAHMSIHNYIYICLFQSMYKQTLQMYVAIY